MNKRLAVIPVTGLVLFTLAGCATTSNGKGTHNNRITKSTTNTSVANAVSGATGSTSNIASSAGNTTNSVQVSEGSATTLHSNYASEIALIRSKGYSVHGTTPNATVPNVIWGNVVCLDGCVGSRRT